MNISFDQKLQESNNLIYNKINDQNDAYQIKHNELTKSLEFIKFE